jgi:hypothetical protein
VVDIAHQAYKKQLQECDTEIKKREATVAETLEGARVFTKGELPDWDGEEIKTNKSIGACAARASLLHAGSRAVVVAWCSC